MKANNGLRVFTRIYMWVLALHIVAGCILLPASAFGQMSGGGTPTSANAPALNRAVQGQNASGVEGTMSTAVSYISNVLGPLASGGFFLHALLAWHNGGKPMRSVMTGVGLLGVSQALRLAEWVVNTGQAGITQ